MKKYKEVNLEELVSTCEDALMVIKSEIKNAKTDNVGCIMFIHGYGSTGKGGKIKEKVRPWLKAQARNDVIKIAIAGEDFDIFNPEARDLKAKYKELEGLVGRCNPGVTVIEL